MARDATGHGRGHAAPTRRDCIKGGGAIIGGGLLAGCTGEDGSGGANGSNGTVGSGNTTTSGSGDESYSVTMSPVGTVTFDEVPESVCLYDAQWADHLVALGQQDRINSLGFPDSYYHGFYEQLPGVSFDTSGLTPLYQNETVFDKEVLYELNSDVHHLDPLNVATFDNWDMADVNEIIENVGPWFANRHSRENSYQGNEPYEYYTIWELSEKFAQVYRQADIAQKLKAVRDEMVSEIDSGMPPKNEPPTVGLITIEEGKFSPNKLFSPGFGQSHFRPLKATDVFAASSGAESFDYEGTSYDYEGMLELDPDIIIHEFGLTGSVDIDELRNTVENDPVGSELTAVKNDRFYAGGLPLQGPIYNIFQIEMAAKQLYPEQFGEWPEVADDGTYEIPAEEQMFDRQRVADIVNGET